MELLMSFLASVILLLLQKWTLLSNLNKNEFTSHQLVLSQKQFMISKIYAGPVYSCTLWKFFWMRVPMLEVWLLKMQRNLGSQTKKQLLCLSSYVHSQRKLTQLINLWTEHHNKASPAMLLLTQDPQIVRQILKMQLYFGTVCCSNNTMTYLHVHSYRDWSKGCVKRYLLLEFLNTMYLSCTFEFPVIMTQDTWAKTPSINIRIARNSKCLWLFLFLTLAGAEGGWWLNVLSFYVFW